MNTSSFPPEPWLSAGLMEVMPAAVYACAADGRITQCNQRARELWGRTPRRDELFCGASRLYDQEDRPLQHAETPMAHALRTGLPVHNAQIFIERPDGGRIAALLNVSPARDAQGAVIGAIACFQDVSSWRDGMREAGEQLEAALTAAGTGTFRWDIRTGLIDCDDNLDRLLRIGAQDHIRSLDDFLALAHPEDRVRIADACRKCALEGAHFDEEFRVIWPDGDVRWLHDVGRTFVDAEGRPTHVTGACVDITARRAAEERLRRSETSFRELADAMPQIVWASRADGHLDYYNRRWYEHTGALPGASGDESWLPILHPADRQRSIDLWYRSVSTGEPYEVEYRLGFPGVGEYRWHLARALPVRDERGNVARWYGTATDIHDQKLAEEELRRTRAEAERANRAKTEFLAVVSHELRTPLNAIGGYTELLELGIHGPLTEAQREALVRIRRSKYHLLALINDVLSYASIGSGGLHYNVTDVPILEVLQEADGIVLPQMERKGIEYQYSVGPPGVCARADRERLHQVLLNLLLNAAKFTPSRGQVRVDCIQRNSSVLVRIADSGPGIPPNDLDRIFEPFVQLGDPLTRTEHGVGLGLSISRDLARGMGGELTVDSTPGTGSTFTVQLLRA
jgi:hypothetical protein